jgi:hypothetical protein
MLDRLDREIDVEVGPVQMMWGGPLHVHKLGNRRVPEPRELLERKKQLLVAHE